MQEKILALIKERDHVSFAELDREIEGFHGGDCALGFPKFENVYIWAGMTEAGVTAIQGLLADKKVHFKASGPLVYLIDGASLKWPIVKRARSYKEPHWAPCTLRLGPPPPEKKRYAKKATK